MFTSPSRALLVAKSTLAALCASASVLLMEPILLGMIFGTTLVGTAICTIPFARYSYAQVTGARCVARWGILILCLFVIGFTAVGSWPVRIAFYLSRQSINDLASLARETDVDLADERRAGCFGVYSIRFSASMPFTRGGKVMLWLRGGTTDHIGLLNCSVEDVRAQLAPWSSITLDDNWQLIFED